MVGREAELARLHAALRKALNGERQVVFVTGEPGIGKTTLVEAFLARVAHEHEHELRIGYGQCIEQYGGGEAYLPLLEAMGRLCREDEGQPIITTLRQYAPTWLVQLSGVIPEAEAQALRVQVQGATQQRMLREMAEAIEAGTTRRPLLLIVEDLHWSDHATVELFSYLATRRERARLFVLGTYRPADVVLNGHPLKAVKQELQAKRQCEEVRLELLSKQEVSDYLDRRFPHHQFPSDLPEEIHHRTEGNALFMVNVVEELLQQGRIVEEQERWTLKGAVTQVNVPDTLRQLIEKQIQQRSDEEQRLLEVASVVGTEFAVAALAAALKQDLDTIEEICEDLAWQGHFLEERGIAEWPDGTVSGRYAFRHALYQNVLYERIAEARQVRLHRLIGERLEAGYGERAKEIAAELAVHFEQGRDYQRAVQYFQQAAEKAIKRSANREAIAQLTTAQALLPKLPDTPEHLQREVAILAALGTALMAVKGYASAEVEDVHTRLRQLCWQLEDSFPLFRALPPLRGFYLVRGELQTARELAEQYLNLAQRVQFPALLVWAYYGLGETALWSGEMGTARKALEQAVIYYDPQQLHAYFNPAVQDPGVACLTCLATTFWALGYPDQGRKKIHEALTLAQKSSHPFTLVWALYHAASHHQLRQEAQLTQGKAEEALTLSVEYGFPFWSAAAEIDQGWALVEQGQTEEGIAQMQRGLTAYRNTGAEITQPYFLGLLAGTRRPMEESQEGLSLITEGLRRLDQTKERFWEAELYRLQGKLTLQKQSKVTSRKSKVPSPQEREAESCFLKAIEVSQKQQAKSWELRATTSLARLWQQQGKRHEAREKLAAVYNWFTEGFDTKDLQEAKALLEELG